MSAKFEVSIRIDELNNIPTSNGQFYVKWYLQDSQRPNTRGKTPAVSVDTAGHKVTWNYSAITSIKLSIRSHDKMLSSSNIVLQVIWDSDVSGSSINCGKVSLDLSAHVLSNDQIDNDLRRESYYYLLKESRINSGLKVGLALIHNKGSTDYIVPKFTKPKVFGDIAGVMEQQNQAESQGSAGSHGSSGINGLPGHQEITDTNKLHDMLDHVNNNIEQLWYKPPGFLTSKDVVEDIFAGGDGFDRSTLDVINDEPEPVDRDRPRLYKEVEEREDFRSWNIGATKTTLG